MNKGEQRKYFQLKAKTVKESKVNAEKVYRNKEFLDLHETFALLEARRGMANQNSFVPKNWMRKLNYLNYALLNNFSNSIATSAALIINCL